MHKADELYEIAVEYDWKSEVCVIISRYEMTNDPNDIVWKFYAMRDHETISVTYSGNKFLHATHKFYNRVTLPKCRKDVVSILQKPPEQDISFFKDEKSPAIDILRAVLRKEITWVRKLDGQLCSAKVDVDLREKGSAKHFRVYEGKNGRVLEWADELGFHTVALDAIIDVS